MEELGGDLGGLLGAPWLGCKSVPGWTSVSSRGLFSVHLCSEAGLLGTLGLGLCPNGGLSGWWGHSRATVRPQQAKYVCQSAAEAQLWGLLRGRPRPTRSGGW